MATLRSVSTRRPRVSETVKFSAARWVDPCEIITPLGIAVVPEV